MLKDFVDIYPWCFHDVPSLPPSFFPCPTSPAPRFPASRFAPPVRTLKNHGVQRQSFWFKGRLKKKSVKKKTDSRTILLKGIPNYTCGNYIPTSKPNSKTPLKMDGDWRRWTFLFLMPAFLGVLAAVSFRELKRDWNEESLKRSVPNIGDLQGTCPTQQHQPPLEVKSMPSRGGLLHMVRSTLGTPKDGPWPPFT